ncbi:dienelactone hydrolase family protein, partial [Thermaurantiacus sp.]
GVAALGYALAAQPVAASAITTPADGLDTAWLNFPANDGFSMRAYRARPQGARNAPLLIVVQEIFGLHEWILDVTRRFALHGFHAIAPDLFGRYGDATKVSDIKTLRDTIISRVADAQVMADLDSLVSFGVKDGGDAKRLGITGFCWGGRITWLYAAHSPRLFSGVAWYGRLVGEPSAMTPKHPIDLVGELKAPVLGLYGTADKGIPVEDVKRMNAALKEAGKASEIRLFEADHGFLADYRPSFSESAAKAAWPMAIGWLKTRR